MPSVSRTTKSPKSALRRKSNHKFTIDCTAPGGKILDVALFEKFLHDKIKVKGKAGNLGNDVTITREKSKIVVQATIPFLQEILEVPHQEVLEEEADP
ncbi:hypothetical protein SAMD00019534_055740, partial [Acytostelium subglobosum LB1]|uniref:hypothetical protein n=1 Tax=Acytostelium subglobosum LB1 TaxID=1410327 RepID=UPI000644D58C